MNMDTMPNVEVHPQTALIDECVAISIANLAAHEVVVLEASCTDKNNVLWLSRATFEADKEGKVHVATQAPISGSYQGVDPMGLFWSMKPTEKNAPRFSFEKPMLEVCLSVFSQNRRIAQKKIFRLLVSLDIEKREIQEQGVVGTLFYQKGMKKQPGIMVVPGSNGGIPEATAQLLASHGYTVLALGYFGAKGLPENLQEIPLEYFQNAMRWLKKQTLVANGTVTLFGTSRGGELVLLVAAMFPGEMDRIIAYLPSNLVYGSFPELSKPAWTYQNRPVAYMPSASNEEILRASTEGKIPFHAGTFEDPLEYTPIFLYELEVFQQYREEATIPVEHIRCPLLLFSGEEDALWPSALYGALVMERLESQGSPIARKHMSFPNAGHGFKYPYFPSIDLPDHFSEELWCIMGGTAEGNVYAARESWSEVFKFLKTNSDRGL